MTFFFFGRTQTILDQLG